jgi:hypothetical protein
MNETLLRRVGMALGMWRFLRYQSQLCRWFPLTIARGDERTTSSERESARWLGKIRLAGGTHHALFVPPGSYAIYRFTAPPRSRFVAWCGVSSTDLPDTTAIEFVATVRSNRASRELTAKLRVTVDLPRRHSRWRKLVLELQN